jgi:hypothetical protein
VRLAISPERSARVLGGTVLVATLASAASQVSKYVFDHGRLGGLVPLVYVGQERSIPTWLTSALFLAAAACTATIAARARRAGDRFAGHWTGLALLCLVLSADQTAPMHEVLRRALPFRTPLAWPALAGGVGVALAVAYRGLLGTLPARTRRDLAGGALLYLVGAVGLELAVAWLAPAVVLAPASARARETPLLAVTTSVEAFLEMLGLVAIIRGALRYLAAEGGAHVVVAERESAVARPETLG